MAYADLPAIREELDVDSSEISDSQLQRYQRRATRLVDERIPTSRVDDAHLADLEILVTGHFAYPRLSGGPHGSTVERVSQESTTVRYATGPDGEESPYWQLAVTLDERIDSEPFRAATL